jgi:cytochrome c
VARSRGAMKHSLRKSCTNNARCTRSHDMRSTSASAFASHSMLHRFPKLESKRTRTTTMRVTSQGPMISRIQKMSSMSSSVETAVSPPNTRRS